MNQFETFLDALLEFEGDPRYEDHINCWADLFDVSTGDIVRDFDELKELKNSKSEMVHREGKDEKRLTTTNGNRLDIYGEKVRKQKLAIRKDLKNYSFL